MRRFAVLTTAVLLMGLSACGSEPKQSVAPQPSQVVDEGSVDGSVDDTQPTQETSAADPDTIPGGSLKVSEQGFTPVDEFISWGAVIQNDSTDKTGVTVTASAMDGDGFALDTDSRDVFRIPAGASVVVGGVFTKAKGAKKVVVSASTDTHYSGAPEPISGTVTARARLQEPGFDAHISVIATSTLDVSTRSGMPFYALFRNSRGAIVGGGYGYTPVSIPAGDEASMSLSGQLVAPQTATKVEVFFDVSDSYLNAQ